MTTATDVWLAIAVIGAGTFLLRFSFLFVFEYLETVPAGLERGLRFVPAAVLAALVVPAVVVLDGTLAVTPGNPRLVAAGIAALVAWRTENILATIVVGMTALLLLQALL